MNHRQQRFRIGVVAVVQDGGACDLEHLAALAAWGQVFDCCNGSGVIDTSLEGDRETRDGVLRVVAAKEVQMKASIVFTGPVTHIEAGRIFLYLEDCRIAAGADAKVDDLSRKVAAELRDVCVRTVEKRDAGGGKGSDELVLGARDAGLSLG